MPNSQLSQPNWVEIFQARRRLVKESGERRSGQNLDLAVFGKILLDLHKILMDLAVSR